MASEPHRQCLRALTGSATDPAPRLTMMSLAPSVTPFRSIKIRGQSPKCPACGDNPSITNDLESVGYDAFCGVSSGDTETSEVERVSVQQLSEVQRSKQRDTSLVLDVRPAVEYGICAIPGSISKSCQSIFACSWTDKFFLQTFPSSRYCAIPQVPPRSSRPNAQPCMQSADEATTACSPPAPCSVI